MYFWNFGDFQVVGASPEILVRQERIVDNGVPKSQITIRPLAGTRKRGATPEEDAALAAELKADPKEVAEHVMLIDLARNDVGRVAEVGSVKVSDTMVIERYSHVMHLVSNVTGTLNPGMSSMDVLRASFPAGTLTGAPGRGHEAHRRTGTGAPRHLRRRGRLPELWRRDGRGHRHPHRRDQGRHAVCAGRRRHRRRLNPEAEWAETEAKARAVLRAAEQVQHGLDEPI